VLLLDNTQEWLVLTPSKTVKPTILQLFVPAKITKAGPYKTVPKPAISVLVSVLVQVPFLEPVQFLAAPEAMDAPMMEMYTSKDKHGKMLVSSAVRV